jgi:hypothetical protein
MIDVSFLLQAGRAMLHGIAAALDGGVVTPPHVPVPESSSQAAVNGDNKAAIVSNNIQVLVVAPEKAVDESGSDNHKCSAKESREGNGDVAGRAVPGALNLPIIVVDPEQAFRGPNNGHQTNKKRKARFEAIARNDRDELPPSATGWCAYTPFKETKWWPVFASRVPSKDPEDGCTREYILYIFMT